MVGGGDFGRRRNRASTGTGMSSSGKS
uniref:Uncharacterized protein n=1 Tax=Arundo donax TaxID=35708 RepID=A0A0A9C380_ARUDO